MKKKCFVLLASLLLLVIGFALGSFTVGYVIHDLHVRSQASKAGISIAILEKIHNQDTSIAVMIHEGEINVATMTLLNKEIQSGDFSTTKDSLRGENRMIAIIRGMHEYRLKKYNVPPGSLAPFYNNTNEYLSKAVENLNEK